MDAARAGAGRFEMPLASRVVMETRDLLAARDHLSRFLWSHSVMPRERQPRVEFRHCATDVGRISINALSYGAGVTIDAYPEEGSYLIILFLHGSGEISQGSFTGAVAPGVVRAMNPTSAVQMKFSPGEANLTIRIPTGVLNTFVQEETGRSVSAPIEFEHVDNLESASAPGLTRWLRFYCSESERRLTGTGENPLVQRQHERALLSLILTEMPNNYSEALGEPPLGAAPIYVRRVEEFIRSHATSSLCLRDLTRVADVSERTLQTGFRRYRDTTPMEYLRDHRLDLARRELETAVIRGRTVTEIALECGFNHTGKFAKCYRQRFGETPSETRKRCAS